MYENEVKNKPLLKFLKKQTCDWEDGEWISNAGDLFRIYHEIMMLRSEECPKTICIKYWNTFFPMHVVPSCIIIREGVFEIDYEDTAEQILNVCVKQLCSKLSN